MNLVKIIVVISKLKIYFILGESNDKEAAGISNCYQNAERDS